MADIKTRRQREVMYKEKYDHLPIDIYDRIAAVLGDDLTPEIIDLADNRRQYAVDNMTYSVNAVLVLRSTS